MADPREAEWVAYETRQLGRKLCPHSGQPLTTDGNVQIPEGTLSCWVCDCFGYDPADKRIGDG